MRKHTSDLVFRHISLLPRLHHPVGCLNGTPANPDPTRQSLISPSANLTAWTTARTFPGIAAPCYPRFWNGLAMEALEARL